MPHDKDHSDRSRFGYTPKELRTLSVKKKNGEVRKLGKKEQGPKKDRK